MSARAVAGRLVDCDFLSNAKVLRLFDALDGAGEELRIVGGAIRNALLGEPVHEIDFASTAEPDEIIRRARAASLKTIATGIDHGTVTVMVDGEPYEVTTLRLDVETDGRRAVVRFGRSFEEDALRRDFTINALSVSRDGTLHDYTNGLDDLAGRRVRFIGEARQRIREDYLRILRFFRFHAAFAEGAMDAEAFHAVVVECEGLTRLSRERVRAELLKLLVAKRGPEVMADVAGAGVPEILIGGAPHATRLARLASIEQTLGEAPDSILRLAALRVQIVEDARSLFESLRLSNAEFARLEKTALALAKLHGAQSPPGAHVLNVLLYHFGLQATRDAMRIVWAESRSHADNAEWRAAIAFVNDAPEQKLPVSGRHLLARGVLPGPRIGELLARIEAAWIEAGFPAGAAFDALLNALCPPDQTGAGMN